MKFALLVLLLLFLVGCASFRARMWSKASDWADELDGTDDVPSVNLEDE